MGSIRLPNLSTKGVYLYYNNLLNYNLNFWYYFYFFFFLKKIFKSIFFDLDLFSIKRKFFNTKLKKFNYFFMLTGMPVLITTNKFIIIKINFIDYSISNFININKITFNFNLLKKLNDVNLNYKNIF